MEFGFLKSETQPHIDELKDLVNQTNGELIIKPYFYKGVKFGYEITSPNEKLTDEIVFKDKEVSVIPSTENKPNKLGVFVGVSEEDQTVNYFKTKIWGQIKPYSFIMKHYGKLLK
tara:strand:+ start:958 stop:1302 length:345 start_codon:yes stop_codon:yes gene_type:complete